MGANSSPSGGGTWLGGGGINAQKGLIASGIPSSLSGLHSCLPISSRQSIIGSPRFLNTSDGMYKSEALTLGTTLEVPSPLVYCSAVTSSMNAGNCRSSSISRGGGQTEIRYLIRSGAVQWLDLHQLNEKGRLREWETYRLKITSRPTCFRTPKSINTPSSLIPILFPDGRLTTGRSGKVVVIIALGKYALLGVLIPADVGRQASPSSSLVIVDLLGCGRVNQH